MRSEGMYLDLGIQFDFSKIPYTSFKLPGDEDIQDSAQRQQT